MATYGDPGFRYHTSVGQFAALLVYRLANDAVLPIDVCNFADAIYLRYFVDLVDLINSKPNFVDLQRELNLPAMIEAMQLLQGRAKKIQARQSQTGFLNDTDLVAKVNAKYRDFQRAFVSQGGLPGREFYKHVIYAPGVDTGYAAVTFPGVTEALNKDDFDLAAVWMNKTTTAILKAADILSL